MKLTVSSSKNSFKNFTLYLSQPSLLCPPDGPPSLLSELLENERNSFHTVRGSLLLPNLIPDPRDILQHSRSAELAATQSPALSFHRRHLSLNWKLPLGQQMVGEVSGKRIPYTKERAILFS